MNLLASLFPSDLLWLANFFFVILFAKAAWRAPWRALLANGQQVNALVGLSLGFFVFWQLNAGVRPGLNFHLIGGTLFTLLFGWQAALVDLTLMLAISFWRNGMDYLALGLNGLVMVALPVLFTEWWLRFSQRELPKTLFMFIFGNGFLCGAVTMGLTILLSSLLLVVFSHYPWVTVLHQYLVYSPPIIVVEAFATGTLITSFTIFAPQCVSNFDDAQYLKGK